MKSRGALGGRKGRKESILRVGSRCGIGSVDLIPENEHRDLSGGIVTGMARKAICATN